jgi:hypothetical protein
MKFEGVDEVSTELEAQDHRCAEECTAERPMLYPIS